MDAPTAIEAGKFPPLTIPANERRAFYISFPNGAGLRYVKDGESRYANRDLVIYGNGVAKRKEWDGAVIYPRTFSGTLHYETILDEQQPANGVASTTTSSNSDYTIGVYYYPWHSRDFHGRQYLRGELEPPQLPALGEYDDTRPAVIAQHLNWSANANINLWVCSWWGPNKREDYAIKNVIMPHSDLASSGVKIALFYETTSRLQIGKDKNYTAVNAYSDVQYMARTYFDDPNYLKIDGKPVLFVYLTRVLSNKGYLEEVTWLMRQAAMDNGGHELYIIGDEVFSRAPDNGHNYEPFDLLDGVTNYDVYGNLGRPDGYAGWNRFNDLVSRNRGWRKETRRHGDCAFVPGISPGYNDRSVRGHRNHTALSRRLYPGAPEGSLFRASLEAAMELTDDSTGNMIMITSWNEWHEDTQIEPVVDMGKTDLPLDLTCHGEPCDDGLNYEAYGGLYLDILREVTSRAGSLGSIEGKERIDWMDLLETDRPTFSPTKEFSTT